MDAVRDTLTLGELRQTAELAERQLVAAGVISEEMVALRRPGASAYPDEGVLTWLQYYNWLGIKTPDGSRAPKASADALRALGEAMSNVPQAVTLQSGDRVAVYPKSLYALQWLEALDAGYQGTAEAMVALEASEDAPLRDAARFAGVLTEGLAIRLWAWILTYEQSDLPFADAGPVPEPPAWTARLTAADIYALWQAHQYVHQETLELISTMFPRDPASPTRLPLHGFLGAEARERGVRASDLMRRWPIGEIFATSVSAAEAQREAIATAKARHGADA